MQVIVFLLVLSVQVSTPQPGRDFAVLGEDVVLRAGPTENHVGVLSLPEGSLLRVGEERGAFREVFVPQGFPVYLHGDFARVDRDQGQVQVLGQRVNTRLLPSTIGLLPVGQVGSDDGALDLLDVEGDWVRVVAPAGLPLYARREHLMWSGDRDGAAEWRAAHAQRARNRERRLALARAGDPNWLALHDLELELGWLAAGEARGLGDAELDRRRARLAELQQRAARLPGGETGAQQAADLLARVEAEHQRREGLAAAAAERVREQAALEARLEAEARALDMGLRFLGRGDPVDIQGVVTRASSSTSEAEVFSISDGVRSYKLSAGDVAELAELVGRTVVLRGRSLSLVSVDGPVLIIDEVLDIQG